MREVKPARFGLRRYAEEVSAADRKPDVGLADDEPPWLSRQEQDTWMQVATIALQLPGLLEAQLQRDAELGLFDYMVLSWLSMVPEQKMRMGELAQLARGSMSRLSNVVKRLEQRGFVERAPDPTNGRYIVATLTDAGWATVVAAAPGHVRAVRRYVLDPLTADQVRDLGDIGGRMAERIRGDASGGFTGATSNHPRGTFDSDEAEQR
jgi:DNA-binding MarR family transcriptional regulator